MSRFTLVIAFSLLVGAALSAADGRSHPRTHTVLMEGMEFRPEALTVRVGDSIVWVNKDLVPHTATTDRFDSGTIPAGKSWKYTVGAKGEFPYGCTFHPTMRGALRVK